MTSESAQTIALQALAWLAGNDELMPLFMGATGASAETMATEATAPAFQISVLEFLTQNDDWVIGFCDDAQLAYETPMQALAALPGGARYHWT
jgi:hypothetical protein